jgi:hypothetical protein
MRRSVLWGGLMLCLVLGAVGVFFSGSGTAGDIHPDFQRAWERTDRPVAYGETTRTWMWGPHGNTDAFLEPYADAPGGQRLVQYFDKTHMEITDPDGDPDDLWHVTNGLLAWELITGQIQVGDSEYEHRHPAVVPIAGDAHPDSPTYGSFKRVLEADSSPHGETLTQTINRSGMVGTDDDLGEHRIVADQYVEETGHTVASVFWEFMNSTGTVFVEGASREAYLFENPFFGVGLPITGAYWVHVPVEGEWRDVLIQCFERRCLTYTPDNPDGWQVEAGNIGQHYYEWRYESGTSDLGPPADEYPVNMMPSSEDLGPPIPDACEAHTQATLVEISDSLSNVNPHSWGQGTGGDWPGGIEASPRISPERDLTFSISADGDCGPLEYRVQRYRPDQGTEIIKQWTESNQFQYTFEPDDAGDYLMLIVDVRNQDPRNHFEDRDDYTYLTYVVE